MNTFRSYYVFVISILVRLYHHIICNSYKIYGSKGKRGLIIKIVTRYIADEKKQKEAYDGLKHSLETPQLDNLKILLKIFSLSKEDPQCLLNPEKNKVCLVPGPV